MEEAKYTATEWQHVVNWKGFDIFSRKLTFHETNWVSTNYMILDANGNKPEGNYCTTDLTTTKSSCTRLARQAAKQA